MRRSLSTLRLLNSTASHPKFKNYPLPPPFARISLRGEATGDDCSVAGPRFTGVADGVGQWNRREHGSAGLWSRLIITKFADGVDALSSKGEEVDGERVVEMLETAYHEIMALCKDPGSAPTGPSPKGDWTSTSMSDPLNVHGYQPRHKDPHEYQGSTTLLVSVLTGRKLHVVNIGDSSLLIFRGKELVYESEPQSHWFDCPFQIGHNSPDTPKKDAQCEAVEVEPGDVVVTSTDGLGDNIYPAQILEVLQSERDQDDRQDGLNRVAAKLVAMAREKMQDEWGESPFGDRAICEGIGFMGGKKDDVSIVVSEVVEQDE